MNQVRAEITLMALFLQAVRTAHAFCCISLIPIQPTYPKALLIRSAIYPAVTFSRAQSTKTICAVHLIVFLLNNDNSGLHVGAYCKRSLPLQLAATSRSL